MQSLLLQKACVMMVLLLFLITPASSADKFKRIAVMPFENIMKEKSLDWIGGGIAELLTTDLGKFSEWTVVERSRLNDALREIKLGQSASVDPATAQKMGKILGADSIIVGSFQKFQDDMRIVARVIRVETAEVRSTARVDGAYKNLLSLQNDISVKLAEGMKGSLAAAEKRKLEALPSKNLDAVQALSDGAYFLRNDLIQDAVKEFDRAIALDPNFTEAHYYKGVALAKLKQWDDAIASLKRTLPRTTNEQRVKWSWDAPFESPGSQRGLFIGHDGGHDGIIDAPKSLAYSERIGKNTILYLIDLAKQSSSRVEIPDNSIVIGTVPVVATDLVTMIPAITPEQLQARSLGFYGISPGGGVLWNAESTGQHYLRGNTLLVFDPNTERILALDPATHQKKWERDHIIADSTSAQMEGGDLAIIRSIPDNKFHCIRLSDGQDVWTLDYPPGRNYQRVTDQALIVFEENRRVFAVDLTSGKVFVDLPAPTLLIQNPDPGGAGAAVPSLVQDNLLYFVSVVNELYVVDLNRSTPANRQLKWKTQLPVKIQSLRKQGSRIYAGAATGELLIIDADTGSVQTTKKVAERNLNIIFAGDSVVLGSTYYRGNVNSVLFALDPKSGNKQWEYANILEQPKYFKGMVLVRPSAMQVALLDSVSGSMIWRHAGSPIGCWYKDDSAFVIETNGVKEYALDRSVGLGITNKEAMTELASVFLSKGDLDEAERLAGQVARDADSNYPALRLVQARLSQARGNALNSRRELVTYVDLVGRQSKAGQEAIADLKRNAGLSWQAETGELSWISDIVDGKIFGTGGNQVVTFNAASGKTLWRQNAERLLQILYDDTSKRIFYAHGQYNDGRVVHLYVIGIDGVNRREVVHFTGAGVVAALCLAYSNNRLFTMIIFRDQNSGKLTTFDIDAFDAGSGSRLWHKTHELQNEYSNPSFFLQGNFLVYSIGKNFWILQAETGEPYFDGLESEVIMGVKRGTPPVTTDTDLVFFSTGLSEIVAYRLSSKKEVLRTRIPGGDRVNSVKSMQGTILFEWDGPDIVARDVAPELANADRTQWRLSPGPSQRFDSMKLGQDYLTVIRKGAGAATDFPFGGALGGFRYASWLDETILQLEPATGKILREFYPLWAPRTISMGSGRLYAVTFDGMVYAMDVK